MTPATGGEGLVSWNRALGTNEATALSPGGTTEFPTDSAGAFTATATCGSSSASTNLNIYQIIGVSASPNLVAAGDPVTLTATTEPGSCPLPLTWNVSTNSAAMITNTFGAPGFYPVTVSLGISSNACVVTNVGIALLEFLSPDEPTTWQTASSAYPYIDDAYEFRVTPDPQGASWPSSWPKWLFDGTDAGQGTTKTRTFGALSSSVSDLKTVTARCGTSTKSLNAVVLKVELESTPDDDFLGRSLSEYGIGEVNYITNVIRPSGLTMNAVGVSWGTNGFPSSTPFVPSSPVAVLRAWIPGNYPVDLVHRNRASVLTSKNFAYILPEAAEYVFLTAPQAHGGLGINVGPLPLHFPNTLTAVQGFEVWVKPATVSWENIQFYEGYAECDRIGMLAANGISETYAHPELGPFSISRGIANKGCKVNLVDAAGLWMTNSPPVLPPYPNEGKDYGILPLRYRTTETDAFGTFVSTPQTFDTASFEFIVTTNGNMNCIKKGKNWSVGFTNAAQTY